MTMESKEAYYENVEAIFCPGMPTSYRGTRLTIDQWKARYPHLTNDLFGDNSYLTPFRKVFSKDIEADVIVQLAYKIIEQNLAPYDLVLNGLKNRENEATDTTVRYAMRIAHDTLKDVLSQYSGTPSKEVMEKWAHDAWYQHTR